MVGISPFVASVSTRITRHATAYTASIDELEHLWRIPLDGFTTHAEEVLNDYDPPSARRRHAGTLVFAHLYSAARAPLPDEEGWRVPSAVMAALLAAEVEFRGPLRLSSRQNTLLAEVYELIGAQLSDARAYTHAALAFRRAMALYRVNEDDESEDRCGLQLARANTRALRPGLRRLAGQGSYLLCGHGYRPSWLLGWVVLQMVVFTAIAWLIPGEPASWETVYPGVTSILNPVGFGDTVGDGDDPDWNAAVRILFVIESWTGAVSMSVFFALLVRKWFRM